MQRPDPPLLYSDYRSTRHRAPLLAPVPVALGADDLRAPFFDQSLFTSADADLTRQSSGEPQGQRIVVAGRVLDSDGRPVRESLVEIWQSNAAGRYAHDADQHDAPLDPHFPGFGRTLTDRDGWYRFVTIKPGAYPLAKPPERVASRARARLAVRHLCRSPPRHADVPSGRPAAAPRSDLNSVPAEARDRLISVSIFADDRGRAPSGSAATSCCDGRHSTPFGL